jgi:flagellar biosynthesis protein FlhF
VRGSIRLAPGRCNVVALVGPTGVGKTTTIAKLAANFRLKEKSRVGLITVDTYRIAAVEQLRTYAEIMDLPMEVVATPQEMQAAIERLSDLDLVLIDTAGRSPRDEAHIQELRSMLAEADADEVHLVLSSVTSGDALERSVEQFREVGATHLLLTKVDEAVGLGSLVPLLKRCELPLTYVTNGQNVPTDIVAAQRRALSRMLIGEEA